MTNLVNITRRNYATLGRDKNVGLRSQEERVSEWSRFVDPIWTLTVKVTIYWMRLPSNMAAVREPFGSFMQTVKRLAYLLLTERQQTPPTVYRIVQRLKKFVCWLLSQEPAVRRFRDVTQTMLDKYLSTWRSLPDQNVGDGSARAHLRALEFLFHYKDDIGDGLLDYRILAEYSIAFRPDNSQAKT